MLKRFASDRGFTLIELLVVILIIGILAAIALPTFLNQQNKAKDSEATQALNTAYKVAKSEATSNGGDFPSAAALVSAISVSEPQLTVASSAGTAGLTADRLYVVGTPSGRSITLAYLSESGTLKTLTTNTAGVVTIN